MVDPKYEHDLHLLPESADLSSKPLILVLGVVAVVLVITSVVVWWYWQGWGRDPLPAVTVKNLPAAAIPYQKIQALKMAELQQFHWRDREQRIADIPVSAAIKQVVDDYNAGKIDISRERPLSIRRIEPATPREGQNQ